MRMEVDLEDFWRYLDRSVWRCDFSRDGARALFEYFEDTQPNTLLQDIDFNDFKEGSYMEVARDYGLNLGDDNTPEFRDAVANYLVDHTTVIEHELNKHKDGVLTVLYIAF